MCNKECTSYGEVEEVITREEIIKVIAQGIYEGECVACSCEALFDMAYEKGKKDSALESIEYYTDVLEEE